MHYTVVAKTQFAEKIRCVIGFSVYRTHRFAEHCKTPRMIHDLLCRFIYIFLSTMSPYWHPNHFSHSVCDTVFNNFNTACLSKGIVCDIKWYE